MKLYWLEKILESVPTYIDVCFIRNISNIQHEVTALHKNSYGNIHSRLGQMNNAIVDELNKEV